jgi:hypothetical protein
VLQCIRNGSLFPEGLDCPGSLGRELGQNAVEVLEIQQLTFCACRLIGDFIKEEMADQFFTNIGNKIESFFGGGDALPWTDSEMIAVSLSSFLPSVDDANPILAEHGVLVNDFSLHLSDEWIPVISTRVHEFDLFVIVFM